MQTQFRLKGNYMCSLCKYGKLFDDSHCLTTALTQLVGWLFQLLWNAKHKKVEVTLLTLWDVRLTSSYETLQTNAFATSPPILRKQLRWRFGVFSCFSAQIPTSVSATLHLTLYCSFFNHRQAGLLRCRLWILILKTPFLILVLCCCLSTSRLKMWLDQSFLWGGRGGRAGLMKKVTRRNIL